MITKLAEELYAHSIQLKKHNSKGLLFRKNRLALRKELCKIQSQVYDIVYLMKDNPDYSIEYTELTVFMSNQIIECLEYLKTKSKNYRNTVIRYIWGFHNLPRAFLSSDNSMYISPAEAIEYYVSYLKFD